jgi:hypothetical protein
MVVTPHHHVNAIAKTATGPCTKARQRTPDQARKSGRIRFSISRRLERTRQEVLRTNLIDCASTKVTSGNLPVSYRGVRHLVVKHRKRFRYHDLGEKCIRQPHRTDRSKLPAQTTVLEHMPVKADRRDTNRRRRLCGPAAFVGSRQWSNLRRASDLTRT